MKRTPFKAYLVMVAICMCNLSYSADLDILVIGSSKSYSDGTGDPAENPAVKEEAFSPANIATQLNSILSNDPAITDNVNVVVEDIFRSKYVDTAMGGTGDLWPFTYYCYSLMQYCMWPDGKAARMSNLRGEGGTTWDYVIIMGDPYLMANMPGVYAEGVKLLVNEISSGTTPATPILLAQWPENSSTFTATQFNEIVYRVGNTAEVQVVPAGKAWDTMTGQDTHANHPTPKGAYLAASAIYSKIYDKSAKTSNYTYDDAIADHALTKVQENASASQYTGTYSVENVFQMKYFKGRMVDWCEYGTSTEEGFADGLKAAFPIAGVSNTRRTGSSGDPADFSYSRGTDSFEADKQYDYGTRLDNDNWTYGFPIGDHSATGAVTMIYGIDKRYYNDYWYYNGTDLGVAYSMVMENQVPIDVRGTPVRLLWAKMNHAGLGLASHADTWHLSNELNRAVGAYMYTMVSGRCPIEDEPATSGTTEWKQWFCRKLGYETAWQMSHLTTRVPGFQVLPSATTALTVTPGTTETMTVKFRYSPQSPVTVTIAANATSAAIVNPKTLTFDNTNYETAQSVNVVGVPGATSAEIFTVDYTTTSDDEIYSGLSDSWEYTNNRASTESVTIVNQSDRQEIAPKNGSKTISLNVAGSLESNTVLAMPFHGTLSWSGPNVVYTPDADYLGNDTFAFAVNTGGTLTRGYVEITVEDVPEVKIVESGGTTDVVEGGATDTYDVFLSEAPVASVTVTISTDSQANVSPTTLTFTTGDWSTPQTVTVTAENDTIHELTHTGTVSHTTSSSDPNWDAITVNDVIATITDNDNQAPTVEAGTNQTLVLSAAEPWTPAEMTAVAWYDATDYSTITESSGAVSQWNDKSGNGNNITTTTSPTYRSSDSRLNNMPSIGYDQARKYLQTPSMTTRNVYVVTYYDDPDSKFDSWDILISSQDATPRFGGQSGQNYFQDNGIDTAYLDGETSTNYSSSVTVLPMDASIWTVRWDADETGTWKILGGNASYNAWLHGAVGEVIFTDGTESLATTQKIEGYLAHKWGLEGNLPAGHPYKVDGPQAFGVTGNLDGTVGDLDGDSLTTTWSRTSGPVSAVLGDTAAVDTTATFTETGTYVFRLTADDTMDQTFDEVTITVNGPATDYTVTYDGNGNTGGTAPGDQTKTEGVDLTLATNSGNLVKTGSTFAGWNTSADGTGTNYAEGATYTADADLTLYAKWTTLPTYTVTYNGNGNTGGTAPGDQTKTEGIDLTIATNSGLLVKTGFIFSGWNTAIDGNGTDYATDATYTTEADLNLFAKWTAVPTYTVSYNGNGNSGGTAPADQTKTDGIDLTLATNSGSLVKTDYTFAGWNTATDGTGTDYAEGATYTTDADLPLYAKWTAVTTYTVTYNGNGNTGGTVPSDQTKTEGIDLTLATNSGSLVKTDYTFVGWNTATDGTGTDYAEGATYTTEADLDLYAKWNAVPTVSAGDDQSVTIGAGDPWSPADVSPVAWYDPSDQSTLSGSFLSGQLGVLDVTANGGINPATGEPWKAGDKYRLVFACENGGGIDATATEIGTYNSHIMNIAANSSLGDLTVSGTVQWKCLGSTAAVNVKTNTGIDVAVTNIPILKTNSAVCATNYPDLFDGSPTSRIDSNEDGNTVTTGWTADYGGWTATWTGTAADGTTSSPLGGATVRYGLARDATGMVFSRSTAANTGINSLYGISGPLEIVFSGTSGAVSQLRDKSGNGNHASQSTGSAQPTYRSSDSRLNNMPTIGYDQAKKFLDTTSMGTKCIYAVTYYDDPDTFDSHRAFINSPDNTVKIQGSSGSTNWAFLAYDTAYRDGNTTNTASALPMGPTLWRFTAPSTVTNVYRLLAGLQSYQYWEYGAIGEVIFTDGTETLETQQKIEGYLAHKWGTAASLPGDHPYKDAAPGGGSAIVTLAGTVNDTDDTPTHTWSDTGTGTGTGTVTFADETALDSTATFTDLGTYILRLTADDGNTQVTDDVVINVADGTTFTVTYNGNGADSGDAPVDANNPYDADATVAVLGNTGSLVKAGYTFAGWNSQADGNGTGYAAAATFTITADTTLYAKWTINQYTITFNSDGGSAVADITLDYDATVTPPANPTKTGYTFAGWSPSLPATMPVDGLAVTAQWTVNQYTITFDSDGGSAVADITLDYDATLTPPADPTKTGYTFAGWSPSLPATMPVNGLAVTAQWTVNQYTITFDSDGGTPVTAITQNFGSDVTAPTAPTKTGYTFNGWSPVVPTTMPASDTTCIAQWTHDGNPHAADTNNNWSISQSEVESFIGDYSNNSNTVTGDEGSITAGRITMREVMRVIYLYNDGGAYIGGQGTVDGYEVAAVTAPPAPETTTPGTGTVDTGDGSLVVSSTADSGVGSLRDAIAIAANGETITIDDSIGTIILVSEIIIDKSIAIDGNSTAIVSGDKQTRVFRIQNDTEAIDVTLKNIGISDATNATDEFGGAIYNNGQTLTLDTVLFDWNSNTAPNGKGGAVYSSGILNTENCVFSNNTASEENDIYQE